MNLSSDINLEWTRKPPTELDVAHQKEKEEWAANVVVSEAIKKAQEELECKIKKDEK